jgi:hypothetical protein
MAKVREQANNTTGTNRDDMPAGQTGFGGWMGRLGQVLLPRQPIVDTSSLDTKRGANGTTTNVTPPTGWARWDIRPKSQMGKLIFGMLIYFLGSQLLEFGLALVFNQLKISLTARQTLFPANTWVVGGLTNFSLIYFVLIALFVWLLFRFNVIPRDFLRPASQRNAARNQGATSGTVTGAANGSAGATRHSGRQRLAMTAPVTKAKRPLASAVKTTAPQRTAVKAAAPRANGKTPPPPSADEAYERVKARQRARRRRH